MEKTFAEFYITPLPSPHSGPEELYESLPEDGDGNF